MHRTAHTAESSLLQDVSRAKVKKHWPKVRQQYVHWKKKGAETGGRTERTGDLSDPRNPGQAFGANGGAVVVFTERRNMWRGQSRSVGENMVNSAWTLTWRTELEISVGPQSSKGSQQLNIQDFLAREKSWKVTAQDIGKSREGTRVGMEMRFPS